VLGGGPCYLHGGRAPQVAARREQRVLLAEAQTVAPTVVMAEPEEVLLGAMHDANATLQAIKGQLSELRASAGAVNPALLVLIGDWLDRVARIGKIIVDGEIAEKLERRIGWVAQDRAATLWGHLAAVVEASPLTAEQRLAVWQSRFNGLRRIGDGLAPFRLSDDALHRFGDGLLEAAAREQAAVQAAAAGVVWDDSGPNSDSDDEVGPLVLFPSSDGDGFRG
jgi:hypothetical protein